MSRCDAPRNPLARDGTTQAQRLVAALAPSHAPLDERDVEELLLYASRLAEHLDYYPIPTGGAGSGSVVAAGDWRGFIDGDVSTLVAVVGAYDVDVRRAEFAEHAAVAASDDGTLGDIAALLGRVWPVAQQIDEWHRASTEGLLLRSRLARFIDGTLAEALGEAWAYGLRLGALDDGLLPPSSAVPGDSRLWGELPEKADASFLPTGDVTTDRADAVRRVTRVYERFHGVLLTLRDEAPRYLRETLEDYPGHQPHLALFLTFLVLLRHARSRLNEVTSKHLRFYYEKVLRLARNAAVPDRVHVVFELARDAQPTLLPAATALKAGKDANGKDVTFATVSDLVVNTASVGELKTVYVDSDETDDTIVVAIHAAGTANSPDGKGAEITREDGSWDTFGSDEMPHADIGFAVASPVLRLAQGTRTVTVTLATAAGGAWAASAEQDLEEHVTVRASGEKAWIKGTLAAAPFTSRAVKIDENAGTIAFRVEFAPDADPIVGFDAETLTGGYPTTSPVLRFVLDETTDGYAYRHLEGRTIVSVRIDVEVEGVTDLLLENDTGTIDPAKPFMPFGATPRIDSNFLVGSDEVFRKQLDKVDLTVTWADLPRNDEGDAIGFAAHYEDYPGPAIATSSFKVDLEILERGSWRLALPSPSEASLFDSGNDVPLADQTISVDPAAKPLLARRNDLAEVSSYEPTTQQGFIRLRLQEDFRHAQYASAMTTFQVVIEAGKSVTLPKGTKIGGNDPLEADQTFTFAADTLARLPIPGRPPYTPLIEAIELGYEASHTIDLVAAARTTTGSTTAPDAVFQIWPFGVRRLTSVDRTLPEFTVTVRDGDGVPRSTTAAGTLYIGLDDLQPQQNVSLLIQVAEGTAATSATAPTVGWSYLSKESWIDFAANEVLEDGTNDLTTSGIVKLAMPAAMTAASSVLTAGRHWIKASVDRDPTSVCRAVTIVAQAVTAVFSDSGNDPSRLATPLPATTISKLVTRRSAVKSITQPAASFGGRVAETDDEHFVRVSERLRHRNRAVTIFDYERIVLENYPEVYKVRCINHTDASSEYAPGKVRVVVIPDLRNRTAVDPLRPVVAVGTRERIRRTLVGLATDFADITVTDPDFEEVRARFRVRFEAGRDVGYYTGQLDEDIVRFLSPWRYGASTDLSFGGRIHRSWILEMVEQLDYVDFVADFTIDHILADGTVLDDVEEATASRSSTVLVSAESHEVVHDLESCRDELTSPAGEPPPTPKRFLGNTRTLELHDRENRSPNCQIDEIAPSRRVYFDRFSDGIEAGHDPCRWCFGKELSKR